MAALLAVPFCLSMAGPGTVAMAESVRVAQVVDATTLRLADGEVARLAGIVVPDDLRPAVESLVRSTLEGEARVRLERVGSGRDRYRRRLVDLVTADARWLQGLLVGRGLAIVDPGAGSSERLSELFALERVARDRRIGVWRAGPAIDAADARDAIGRYALVRGEVLSVGTTRSYVYLNFGPDYRTDFTLRIRQPELDHVLSRSGVGLEDIEGRLVEARGFALSAGGPLIELSHPEQIEVLR